MKMLRRKITHWFTGHIPYFVYEREVGREIVKTYYCTICRKELEGGVYHWLYDVQTNKREV